MPKPAAERLTRREREIMNAVFALENRASAEDVRAKLTAPPSDSSVRVMLARLEKKGLIQHVVEGVRFVYSTTESPAAAKRTALKELVETFFNGSTVHLMTSLVRQGTWNADDLHTLEAAIERAREDTRPAKSTRR